jgi:hypothetical protein
VYDNDPAVYVYKLAEDYKNEDLEILPEHTEVTAELFVTFVLLFNTLQQSSSFLFVHIGLPYMLESKRILLSMLKNNCLLIIYTT